MTQTRSTQTENWLSESRQNNVELFSEMDVLLRALDRYFIADNLPPSREHISGRNFLRELEAARDGAARLVVILETIIPERNRSAYWFQKFTEARLLDARQRERIQERRYLQHSPEQSLYVLYDAFNNLKTVMDDILKSGHIAYMSLQNMGQILRKELRENVHFNPFRKEVDLEFDVITNPAVARIVRKIEDRESRKTVSVAFLYLFRFLRFLRHVDYTSQRPGALHCSVLILMLIHAEISQFRRYVETSFHEGADQELRLLMQGVSYQFAMSAKRVYQQELLDLLTKRSPRQMRGKIQNSHGILKNLTEQAVIQIARFWEPDITDEEVFEIFITKASQSVKLREDLYVLHRIINEVEKKAGIPEENEITVSTLMTFMDYFEGFTFKLLRYDDYEAFMSLFSSIKLSYQNKAPLKDLLQKFHQLDMLLETTLMHVENRGELRDRPLDIEKTEDVVRQYLPHS